MNLILILVTFFLANLLFFLPLEPRWVGPLEVIIVILLGISFLVETFLVLRRRAERGALEAQREKPAETAPRPQVAPEAEALAGEAAVVQFLGQLQEKGRLVDFLRDDISPYSDEQVGAAARVVHQGCREVLQTCFGIVPVHGGGEGEEITLAEDFDARAYRLVGRVPDRPPYRGTVQHRGWKTERVNLPRVASDPAAREIIAPAEVDIA